jgi:hypothetical protein
MSGKPPPIGTLFTVADRGHPAARWLVEDVDGDTIWWRCLITHTGVAGTERGHRVWSPQYIIIDEGADPNVGG